jgi:hypothetical protein
MGLKTCWQLCSGTSRVGQLVIGKIDESLLSGPIVLVPNIGGNENYAVFGDVTINNKIVLTNQTITMDTGTNNIQPWVVTRESGLRLLTFHSPVNKTQEIFGLLGYPSQRFTEDSTDSDPSTIITVLNGYFNSDDPPVLGCKSYQGGSAILT